MWIRQILSRLFSRERGNRKPDELPLDVEFFGDQIILLVPDSLSLGEMWMLRDAWEKGWRPLCYGRALRNRETARMQQQKTQPFGAIKEFTWSE